MQQQTTLASLQKLVSNGEKFTMMTAYDATFAKLISRQGVDSILVGDSLGMVCQGHNSTVPVTNEQMVYHTANVARGNEGAFLVADMPFNTYATLDQALSNAGALMQAGAQMVKLEGGAWLNETIQALGNSGMPTCIHLGLTPQSVNKFGGFRVQGREAAAAKRIIDEAISVAQAGADLLLLECVPSHVTDAIMKSVDIPVVGIGAGNSTNAQVLVCYDLLGLNQGHMPRFVKNYMTDANDWSEAINNYIQEVKTGAFPAPEHAYD